MADPASVESDLAIVASMVSASPPFPRYYVPRPRLHRQIDEALDDAQVVLIRAPAVSGKTTLLRAWCADTAVRTAYIGLEALDNDPAHFWARFAAVVRLPLAAPVSSVREARRLVERLRNDVDPRHRLVVVLDRTDVLDDADVSQVLGELLLDLPDPLSVVLAGRAEPAPGLRTGLLRARGQLAELRADDLAFRRDEMATLLGNVVELTPGQLDELHARTEGWVGGVTLAGLALLRAPDRTAVVEAMTGSNRYIAELLAAEVVDPQPTDVQAFLLATSVLDTMDGALADAVTGGRGGARMLDDLEAAGLFIEGTGDSRGAYRYRPLFRDFLRHRLHVHHPDREVAAHLGAAREHERRGDVGAAVSHYVAAGDEAAAVRLVVARGESVAAAGRLDTVTDWIARLPLHGLHGQAAHLLAVGRLCVTVGMLDEAAVWLDAARLRLEGSDDRRLLATHALLTAYTSAAAGDLEHAADDASRVLALVTEDDRDAVRARANQLLVGIYATLDQLDAARRHSAETPPDAMGLSPNQSYSAWLAYRLGLLDHATSYAEAVLRTSDVPWHMGAPLVTRGAVRRERNQIETAEPDLIAGIDASRRWSRLGTLVLGTIELARLRFSQRREAEAFALLTEARPQAGGHFLTQLVAVAEATLHLRSGDVERARFGREELTDGPLTAPLDVRLALVTGRLDGVPERLRLYEENARSLQKRIVAHLLRARFAVALDDPGTAADHVRQALEWGRRERFVQVFAADLPALETVFRKVVANYDDPYPFGLLAAVAEPRPAGAATLPLPADFEPLSEREQIVLRYLPTALSNKRIAAELHMSVNTLKTHLKSIYRKLRAASRDESVARARELHLL